MILINYVSLDPTLSNSVKTFPQYPQFCLTLINPIHFVSLSYNLFTSIWFYWILSDSTWSLYFTKINFSCLYLIFLSSLTLLNTTWLLFIRITHFCINFLDSPLLCYTLLYQICPNLSLLQSTWQYTVSLLLYLTLFVFSWLYFAWLNSNELNLNLHLILIE